VQTVSGRVAVGADIARSATGTLEGALSLSAAGIGVAGSYGPDSIGEFVADLLTRSESLDGSFSFIAQGPSDVRITEGSTNLDDVVAGAVRERVEATLASFREDLNERLVAYLDPQIDALAAQLDGVVDIETSAEELLALARDREAAAAELERLARESLTAVRDQLEAEAQRQLDAARAEAEARAQAAADEAEEAARDAVEDAAGDAVDTIRNRIQLPGRR
jgi:hypothetical protein